MTTHPSRLTQIGNGPAAKVLGKRRNPRNGEKKTQKTRRTRSPKLRLE